MIPAAEYSQTLHGSSMRPMPRTLPSITPKYPMHTVTSQSRKIEKVDSGLTFSMEKSSDTPAAQAEYEVLKAILSRESYLQRLQEVSRTVGKKFKADVADLIDFVRMSSLDVVQAILKWRELKGDMDATFVWNGLNYLLKMPSDLDYLADYLAIQKWMGFPLVRNPFCIPYPMESANQHLDELTDPQNIDSKNLQTSGYAIGGRREPRETLSKTAPKEMSSALSAPSPYESQKKPRPTTNAKDRSKGRGGDRRDVSSFIFNEDMKKIRHAESVILAAEARFGVFSRDPNGRLVPIVKALTSKAALELKKDDRRPLSEPAESSLQYAPHAANSDVGVAHASWTPEMQDKLAEAKQAEKSKFYEEDTEVNSRIRGESKSGGALASFELRGADSRGRKPIKASISTAMDFRRERNIKTFADRIQEINDLKAELEAAKQTLNSDSSTSAKLQVIRSALSNNRAMDTSQSEKSLPLKMLGSPSGAPAEKYQYSKPPDTDNLIGKLMKSASSNKISVSNSEFISAGDRPPSPGSSPTSRGMKKQLSSTGGEMEKKRSLSVSFIDHPSKDEGDEDGKLMVSVEEPTENNTEVIAKAKTDLEKEIGKLGKDEFAASRSLGYFLDEQGTVAKLKNQERSMRAKERSRDIERKRRLLSEDEGRRLGPPPEDKNNVYDFYAVRVQSLIRGWLARCWVKWYKLNATKACIMMQSVLRGWFGRMRVRKIRKEYGAATVIQKNFRGWSERGTSVTVAKQRNLFKKAIVIQRVWRGLLGKKRANSKRALDKAAKEAFDAVDAKSLVAADVKELAKRLIYAIEEPTTTSFPPDEVLQLIRLSVLILQSARGNLGIAEYDYFNIRHYEEHSGAELDWSMAAKMVNRSERFIRLVRAVAFGPGAKPPRLLQLSTEGNLLYAAMQKNPLWKIATFETMGMGSKICCQLFKWLTSIVEIAIRQQEFLSLIATSFPDWLPKLNGFQASARYAEFDYELNSKCFKILQEHYNKHAEDPTRETYLELLDKEMKIVKKFVNDARTRSKDSFHEISKVKNDQNAREIVAIESMEQRCIEADESVKELAALFKETSELAARGDRRAIEAISELRHNLTNQKLKLNELSAQKKLLEIQIESNRAKRKDPAQLPPDILSRTLLAGESKAAHLIAYLDTAAMLKSAGVKDPMDLPLHLTDIYEELALKEGRLKGEARARYVDAEQARLTFDDSITREMAMAETKEQKSKDQMMPTDVELEEERAENENEAVIERIKHLQYVPDSVMFDIPKRPRPIVIAMSRDLPGYLKRRIHQQIVTMMPGLFIYLNNTSNASNMGFDLNEMQSILESKKCILMNVDHGLTRVTRDSFLKTLEMNLESLFPKPLIILAVGDEKNMKADYDCPECGVIPEDMVLLRDYKIKSCLEWMSWACIQLLRPGIRKDAQLLATELMPNTKSLGIVLEAYFVLFWNEPINPQVPANGKPGATNVPPPVEKNNFRLPNLKMPSMIWQRTRQILIELNHLYNHLHAVKRGSLPIQAVNCMNQYLKHDLWPRPSDEIRVNDPVLNILATWMEKMVESELLTLESGGVPPQYFTKSSMKGVQAVITVKDSFENLPKGLVISLEKAYERFHWKPSSYLLVRAALQDLRILKTVLKIDNINYTVSVYREASLIYFEVYNAENSEIYMTKISSDQIPLLIIPNGYERGVNASMEAMAPPESSMKMYEKLIKLLKIKVFKDISGHTISKQLICQRDYIPMDNIIRKFDGYHGILKCYESAYGELYFTIYLSEYSLQLTYNFTLQERMILLKTINQEKLHKDRIMAPATPVAGNGNQLQQEQQKKDNEDPTGEEDILLINEARPLLPYIIDRLHIYPSRTMYLSMLSCQGKGGLFDNIFQDNVLRTKKPEKKVFQTKDINGKNRIVVSNVASIINNPNIKDISQEQRNINNQYLMNFSNKIELKMKSKNHGRPGKTIYRKIVRFYDIIFYLLMRMSTPKGFLTVFLYEPITRKTLELKITAFMRKILIDRSKQDVYKTAAASNNSGNAAPGSGNNNNNNASFKYPTISHSHQWFNRLKSLLKVQWNSAKGFSLYLNTVLLKKVIPISSATHASSSGMSKSVAWKLNLLFQLSLVDDDSVRLEIVEMFSSQTFEILLNKHAVFKLLFHKSNLQILQNTTAAAQKGNNPTNPANPRSSMVQSSAAKKLHDNLLGIINHIESELKAGGYSGTASAFSIGGGISSMENDHLKNGPPQNQQLIEMEQAKFEEILLNENMLSHLVMKIAQHLIPKNPTNLQEGFQTVYFPMNLQIPLKGSQAVPTDNGSPSVPSAPRATREYENMKTTIIKKKLMKETTYEYDKLQAQKKRRADLGDTGSDNINFDIIDDMFSNGVKNQDVQDKDYSSSLSPVKTDPAHHLLYQNKTPSHAHFNNPKTLNLSTGTLETVLRTRLQAPVMNLEYELNLLAIQKSHEANQKQKEFMKLTSNLTDYMQNFNNNLVILNKEIFDTTYSVTKEILEDITEEQVERLEERTNPGTRQAELLEDLKEKEQKKEEEKQKLIAEGRYYETEEERLEAERRLKSEENAIVTDNWKKLLEIGCKVNFREGKVTWHGHVSIVVEEDDCWISDHGMGKRYRFTVYEPNVSQHFIGMIRSSKHLKEVLGINGQDLLKNNRQKEMLIFVCRYRLEVVVNKKSWDGLEVREENAAPYRIEFQTDRLYTQDKITPVNAADEEDAKENENKLIEIEVARGRKVVRLVRRISGLLMQLTVFELPTAIAEAALIARPVKGLIIERNKQGGIENIEAIIPDDYQGEELDQSLIKEVAAAGVGPDMTAIQEGGLEEEEESEKGSAKKTKSVKFDSTTLPDEESSPVEASPEVSMKREAYIPPIDPEEGPIEGRKHLRTLKRHLPPAFRIVGYDPKSKRKVVLPVEPQAVIEVCGGIFSPYLVPDRRRELARIVCESLILYFPTSANEQQQGGGGQKGFYSNFELSIPWSGNANNAQQLNTIDLKAVNDSAQLKKQKKKNVKISGTTTSEIEEEDESRPLIAPDLQSQQSRSAADRVNNRKGRVFRSVLRISKYELIVSIYQFTIQSNDPNAAMPMVNNSIIVNFYSPAVTESKEIVLSEQDQMERIDNPIVYFPEGAIRTAAIRRLMRFFKAEIIEDILDATKRDLLVALMPPGKDFITEYKNITKPIPNENTRPVGLTGLFFPLDTCGVALHRCGLTLVDRNNKSHTRDFLVTIYTKSVQEFVERGLIIKLYDRLTCNMSVLHLSASEVIRICHYYQEESLLGEIVNSRIEEQSYQIDEIEQGFKEFTDKGRLQKRTNDLVKILLALVEKDLGFYMSPQDIVVPYIRSSPKGILPE